MNKQSALDQLRLLNQLLGQIASGGLNGRTFHADAAYRYFLKNHKEINGVPLQRAANALVKLHLELDPNLAGRIHFDHWHAPSEVDWGGPLWIRPILLKRLNRLAGIPVVLFLISGLREAICPEKARWTQARRNEYARMRHWIESIAARHHPARTRLQIIVL
jgi:hypothetical protein